MTNILAAIIVTVSTNWVSVGTYTERDSGKSYDVQRGNLQTNVTAILEWKGQRKEVLLESASGPVVAERKEENRSSLYYYSPPLWPTNLWYTNLNLTIPCIGQ